MKLNHNQILIGATATSLICIPVSFFSIMLLNDAGIRITYRIGMVTIWLIFVGYPSLIVSAAKFREVLGERKSIKITSSGSKRYHGRKIPINGGLGGHLVMENVIPTLATTPDKSPDLPLTFLVQNITWSVSMIPYDYSVTDKEVYGFLSGVWDRQMGDPPICHRALSRNHWLNGRMSMVHYYALMKLLDDADLIHNRKRGSSGRLVVGPNRSMVIIRTKYL